MKVSKFMTPAENVFTIFPSEKIEVALNSMIQHDATAIVVLHPSGDKHIPVGIVTKKDLLKSYQMGLHVKEHQVQEIMSKTIETVLDTSTRDVVAKHFETTQHRNAFVINEDSQFVGLVSAFDIAVECARDDRAWPYNRTEELSDKYKVPPPVAAPVVPTTPTSPKTSTKKLFSLPKFPTSPRSAREAPTVVDETLVEANNNNATPVNHTFLDAAGTDE